MAKRRHSELAAGVFVLLALAAGVGVLIWLGVADVLGPHGQRAVFFVPEQAGSVGLAKGSFVQVADAVVGKVAEIRYVPDRKGALYFAEIEHRDLKIYADGQAQVAAGLVGAAVLVVTSRGSEEAGLADEKHPIEIAGGLSQAMRNIAAAAENVREVSQVVKDQLDLAGDASILAKVHVIIEDLRRAATDVAGVARAVRGQLDPKDPASLLAKVHGSTDDMNAITANVRKETDSQAPGSLLAKIHTTADDVNQISADAKPKVSQVLSSVVNTVKKAEQFAEKDIAEILAKLRATGSGLVEVIGEVKALTTKAKDIVVLNRDNIDELFLNMKTMSQNLSAAAKEIRRNPWRLMRRPRDQEVDSQNIYDAARAFAEGAEQLDEALARLGALRRTRPEGVQAGDAELKKVLDHLQTSFEKFRTVEDSLWKELAK